MEMPDKDLIELCVGALRGEVTARLDAADRAVSLSQETLTERLLHSNGLIEQMRQQSNEFSRKSELEALSQRVESLEQARSKAEGTSQGKAPLNSIGMMVIAAVIGAAATFLATRIAG